jgi:pilus assembly protein CpaB
VRRLKGMKKRLLLISLTLAVLAAALVFGYLQSLQKPKNEIAKVTILVANDTIQARTMIEKKMVKKIEVPDSEMIKDYIKDMNLVVGKYAKSTIEKDEGFLSSKLMDKNESTDEITVKIEKNFRAVSINATGDSGVSKLVKPGDYVDVFMYLSEKKDGKTIIRPDLSKMLLENIEVLAIDKKLVRDESVVEEEKETTNFLVTLSVKVEDVGKLILAEDIGSIKLALRSGEKEKAVAPKTITEAELYEINTGSNSGSNSTNTNTNSSTSSSNKSNTSSTSKNTNTNKATNTNKTTNRTSNNKQTSSKTTTNYKYYTVKPGDTLMSISRLFYKNNVDYRLIKKANNINEDNNLEIGKKIKIPIKK